MNITKIFPYRYAKIGIYTDTGRNNYRTSSQYGLYTIPAMLFVTKM